MKLGCASWILCENEYAPPYDKPIKLIGEMGFDGFEMIINEESDISDYFTPSTMRELKSQYHSYDLVLSEFAIHSPLIEGLVSLEAGKRARALDIFKRAVQVAGDMESRAVNVVSGWMDIKSPMGYMPAYIGPFANGVQKSTPKWHMEVPKVDYDRVWANYVESLRACLDIVVAAGMDFYIEAHANVMVGNTDAMLRLFDAIPSERFGVNFDTAWHAMQREYPALALRKLGKRVKHLHMRDCDGLADYARPPGMGVLDWVDIFATLEDIGFDGFCSFEIGAYQNMPEYVANAKRFIEEAMLKAHEGVSERRTS